MLFIFTVLFAAVIMQIFLLWDLYRIFHEDKLGFFLFLLLFIISGTLHIWSFIIYCTLFMYTQGQLLYIICLSLF